MKNLSMSSCATDRSCLTQWVLLAVVLLCALCAPADLRAQGNSIPTTTAVQEQRSASEGMPEVLPEGVKYRYPVLNGLSVSVNLFSPVMSLFGKGYANYEAGVTLDVHHRFFPQASAGVGYCDATSTDEVRYKSALRPFLKVGMMYNFKYNDLQPDDFWGVFARVGFARDQADIWNLYYTDGYWAEQGPLRIDNVSYNSCWLEIGGSIKVKVMRHLSLGWDLSFKPFLYRGDSRQAESYFVSGYGSTASKLGFAFHLYYDVF